MPGYDQTQRAPAQKSADGGAAEHRTGSSDHAPAGDALGAALNESPRSQSLMQLRAALDDSPRVQALQGLTRALNATPEDDEADQLPQDSRPAVVQFAATPDDAGKPDDPPPSTPVQKKPNATGLPDRLKAGVESLSGLPMDDVRVHYNSHKPATVQAHAYAQGTDIHVAPGQEQHLPHEAWHVVQQKQGRVKPTLQAKGVAINDDTALEREAKVMGDRAGATSHRSSAVDRSPERFTSFARFRSRLVQRTIQHVNVIKERNAKDQKLQALNDKNSVEQYCTDKDIHLNRRAAVLNAWNKDTPLDQRITVPDLKDYEEEYGVTWKYEYEEDHGKNHFGRKGSSTWDLDASKVNPNLEKLIGKYMEKYSIDNLKQMANDKNIVLFYIGGQEKKIIGSDKSGAKVSTYTIQVTVNVVTGVISYHGYPDKGASPGIGQTKSGVKN
jgi:hypothetical protein